MDMSKKDQRVPIMMSEQELNRLDDWRFERRIGSRGEAIRRLIDGGLTGADPTSPKPPAVQPSATVKGAPLPLLPDELIQKIEEFRSTRAYLENTEEAVLDLINRGIAAAEDREDIYEIPADMMGELKTFANGLTIEEATTRLLCDALNAWQARLEAEDEPE